MGARRAGTKSGAKSEDGRRDLCRHSEALRARSWRATLDNSAGLLPLEFTEVTVTRVLFRNGDSEYSINGVPCRLLDVQELLSDAGVGRQQHVIVSQGQIDAVLNARPEDRRSIIEEAAGVLKYRKRREKAQRRLDATEANLVRLQDLLREVRRQLKPLERQAHAAQRHVELQAELDTLRVFVAGREIATQRAKLVTIENDRIQASEVQNTSKTRLAELDTSIMGIEAQLSARGASDVRDRLGNVERLIERVDGLLGIIDERRRSLERDRSQGLDADVIATLEADVAGFRSELTEVEAGLAELRPRLPHLKKKNGNSKQNARPPSTVASTWVRKPQLQPLRCEVSFDRFGRR